MLPSLAILVDWIIRIFTILVIVDVVLPILWIRFTRCAEPWIALLNPY